MSERSDEFVAELRAALERSGFEIATDEELQAFLAAQQAYAESPEGQIRDAVTRVHLDYCTAHARYRFTADMDEISGFGGDYEQACRVMLDAGLRWLDAHPNADPKFKGAQGVFGLVMDDNDDAKGLSEAIAKAIDGCSGAMHHAVVNHCLYIRAHGWEMYCQKMRERDDA